VLTYAVSVVSLTASVNSVKYIVKYSKIPTGTDVRCTQRLYVFLICVKVINFTFSCYFLWSAVNMDIGLRYLGRPLEFIFLRRLTICNLLVLALMLSFVVDGRFFQEAARCAADGKTDEER